MPRRERFAVLKSEARGRGREITKNLSGRRVCSSRGAPKKKRSVPEFSNRGRTPGGPRSEKPVIKTGFAKVCYDKPVLKNCSISESPTPFGRHLRESSIQLCPARGSSALRSATRRRRYSRHLTRGRHSPTAPAPLARAARGGPTAPLRLARRALRARTRAASPSPVHRRDVERRGLRRGRRPRRRDARRPTGCTPRPSRRSRPRAGAATRASRRRGDRLGGGRGPRRARCASRARATPGARASLPNARVRIARATIFPSASSPRPRASLLTPLPPPPLSFSLRSRGHLRADPAAQGG